MSKKTIRVAHIIGKWLGGGVEAVVMNYYRNIDHNKVQFDFICDSDSTDIPYEEIKKIGGKVILIPPYQKLIKYHKTLKKVLIEGNYTIVHSHINTLSVFSLYAAKKAKIPIRIAHSHSTTNKKEWKKNILKLFLRPLSYINATHYFSCTEHAGRWMFGNKKFEEGSVYVLNNAIDIKKFKYDEKIREKKRKELGINNNSLVFGHIGRFVAQKNHSFLIDIFHEIYKQNTNAILMLAGQGPLMEEIKNKVEKLGLTQAVIFLGQRNDVNELYQAMDVFLLPSLYEGLGMVLIEAQCSGLPCIASTEVPEVAKISENFQFIDLTTPANIWAEQTIKTIKNYNREDGSDKIDKCNYNIYKEARKLVDKYSELEGKHERY